MKDDLLRIETSAEADRVTVALVGELDVSNAGSLVERLAASLQDGRANLDLDLSRLDYTDSVGLTVFVTAHFQCLDAGVRFRLVNPNLFIGELLAVTGLDQVFAVARTADVLVEA